MSSSESLRGYGRSQLEHDQWKCQYCGLDYSSFELWLFLSVNHIIPLQQQNEVNVSLDDNRNFTTACRMCSGLANRTKFVIPKNVSFEKQVASVFEQKKATILERREEFHKYWLANVKPKRLERT
jgi:5-methylcytosine-specific restriction endonuclease McrA